MHDQDRISPYNISIQYNTKQASDENKEKYKLSGLLKIIIQMMFLIC